MNFDFEASLQVSPWAQEHIYQITATVGLVTYSMLRKKLTPAGVVSGIFVAIVHMLHPWPAFFWLLMAFFVVGTGVTKAGHAAKQHLTQSSTGGTGGEGPRTSTQVFANSGFATLLIALHIYLLNSTPFISSIVPGLIAGPYAPALQKLLPIGIVAQYAAVAADTFSSELGILSEAEPVLITNPWKKVPKGTNGGVTSEGLLSGFLGSFFLTLTAIYLLDKYPPHIAMLLTTAELICAAGVFGTLFDSLLGAVVQVTVTDRGSGKVVEGAGGRRVRVVEGGSRISVGKDLLTNNGVNFVMAAVTSLFAIGVAWVLDLEL